MADKTRRLKCTGCGSYGHTVDTCATTIEKTTGRKHIFLEFIFDKNIEFRVTIDHKRFEKALDTMVLVSDRGDSIIVKVIDRNHFGIFGQEPIRIQIENGVIDMMKLAWADCSLSVSERYEVKCNHAITRIREDGETDSVVIHVDFYVSRHSRECSSSHSEFVSMEWNT